MAEYIERDALIDAMQAYQYDAGKDGFAIMALIGIQPTADVAPVVHCRHCRSYNKPRLGWCSVHLDREGPDDFCGYGVRMDGDAE